jgi:beta-lactamase class D
MKRVRWFPSLLLVLSCARSPAQPPAAAPPPPVASAPAGPSAVAPAAGPRERPELRRFFEAERVTGAIALFDSADGVTSCSDLERCQKGTIPASTFKIPNSMIALETGVVEDSETLLPWDGKHYSVETWNQDHTLRTAIQVSCVPCFKAIARKVGQERMAEWVKRLDYGNRDISGGIDRFWLSGGLRISPLQQLDFLRRFDGNKLPISERTAEIVRDIITLDVGPSHVLRGKTGSAMPPDEPVEAGWFVGWVELGERRVFFATLIDSHEKDVEILPLRRRLTEAVLRDQKLLP